ncbi:MAG: CstA-like transporter-associated (seleno)protein [Alphaproteobacteria bacterium]
MTALELSVRWPIALFRRLRAIARWLRAVTGDDAYERYLEHWQRHRPIEDGTNERPLGRREFFRRRENERWNGVRRCC